MSGTTYRWLAAVDGDWTTDGDWDGPGFPNGASVAAIIAVAGGYSVTLGSSDVAVAVGSLDVSDTGATLDIQAPGKVETVAGDVTNAGALRLDSYSGAGGSTLAVGGTLTNSGYVGVGDYFSTSAASRLTVAALVNTGTIAIGTGANVASLVVGSAAPSVWTGTLDLAGDGLLEYDAGGITSIASGAAIDETGPSAFVALSGDATRNSALDGLTSVAGQLSLSGGYALTLAGLVSVSGSLLAESGTTLTVGGDLSDTGAVRVDTYSGAGGGTIHVGGTLTNSGYVGVGDYFATTAASALTVGALVNTGTIAIGTGTNAASLVAASAAPSVWTGTLDLAGDGLLEYDGGGIASIAAGAQINETGPSASVALSSDATRNSALDGLTSVAGQLSLSGGYALTFAGLASVAGTLLAEGGTTLSVGGDLADAGALRVDTYSGAGGSAIHVAGTLTNSGYVGVGDYFATSAASVLTAGALANTGAVAVGTGTNTASLLVAGAASGAWSGVLTLTGDALLQYGGGGITGIAAGGQINEYGVHARVALASDPATNSALTGLASVAGQLLLQTGASVTTTTDLDVAGTLGVDRNSNSGGSALDVGGTLTNSGFVGVGDDYTTLGASTTIKAAGLVNAGTITLDGAGTNQAALVLAGAAPAAWTGVLNLSADALLQYGGGGITSIASGAQINEYGINARVALASDPATNSALTGLASVAGQLLLQTGASVTTTTDLDVTGTLGVDRNSNSGGSSLDVGGTLTNSGFVGVGDDYSTLGASTTIRAAGLVDAGTITLAGAGTNQAAIVVTGAAPAAWTGVLNLSADALLQYGGGGITSIASGAQINEYGLNSRVALASDPATNSALTGLASVAGQLLLQTGASVTTTTDLDVTGTLGVDRNSNSGGSSLDVGGTLTNSGFVGVGDDYSTLGASTTIKVAGLVNAGTITLDGAGTNQAALVLAGAAPAAWTGVLNLSADALLQYGGGGITSIASGAQINEYGLNSRVALASDPATNSALTGLASVAGQLLLQTGASVTTTTDLDVAGTLGVDRNSNSGGSALDVGGTLTNSGFVGVGDDYSTLGASTTIKAAGLVNAGTITLAGAGTNQAAIVLTGAAPGAWTGVLNLSADALLQYGGGGITSIASGAQINEYGLNSRVALASDPATNSALTGLASVAGQLLLQTGASVTTTTDLDVAGTLGVDRNSNSGGSALDVGGTLTNSGFVGVGDDYSTLGASTTIKAAGLVNAGTITLDGAGTNIAALSIAGAASNSGAVDLGAASILSAARYTQTAGATDVGGALTASVALTGGTLDGAGTITGAVSDDGGTVFGGGQTDAPGTLNVVGAYEQSGDGVLLADLGGTAAGQSSVVAATGGAALDGGTLEVAAVNGFALADGDTFNVLTFAPGQLAGAFASLEYGGATVAGNASLAIGNGLFLQALYNNAQGDVQLRVTSTLIPPPLVTAPATESAILGAATAVTGVSVATMTPGEVKVTLSDSTGALAVTAAAGATVTGDGGASVTLSGALAAVNAELASLTYTPEGAAAADQIAIVATDASLQSTNASVVVAVDQPPVIVLPTPPNEAPGQADPLTGVSVTDSDALATGKTLTVTLSDPTAQLAATASGKGTVTGSGSGTVTISGGLADVNAALATLTFTGGAGTIDVAADDGRGGHASASLAVTASPPPVLAAPTAPQTEFNGATQPLSGVSVSVPGGPEPGEILSVTLAATSGLLAATAAGSATVQGAGTGHVRVTGDLADLNATLGTLAYTGAAGATSDTVTVTTPNGRGGVVSRSVPVTVSAPPPPSVAAPDAAAVAGKLTPIDGVTVTNGAGVAAGAILVVTLADSSAKLDVQPPPGTSLSAASLSGQDTTTLTITGTAAEVDADLAALTFLSSANMTTLATLDTISVTATENGVSTRRSLLVSNPLSGAPGTPTYIPPALLDYTGALPAYEQSTVGGALSSNGYLQTFKLGSPTGGQAAQFAVGADDNNVVPINVSFATLPFATDQGFSTAGGGPVEGVPALSLSYLLTAADQNPQPGDTISYVIHAQDGSVLLPDERVTLKFGKVNSTQTPFPSTNTTNGKGPTPYVITPNGGSFPRSVIPRSQGGTLETHLHELSPTVYPEPPPPHGGDDDGDVHLTTFDGLYYNFQSAGEFVLARSTAPGDDFEVQIRTQPYFNGSAASVTTEAGAAIGAHRVTFDLFRADTVWVDGAPVTLSASGAPYELGAGTLQQLTPTSWELRYDSGEAVVVTKYDSFLDVQVSLTPRAKSGTVQGLLGSFAGGEANEFTLPDGTVLKQPLSYDDLYQTWADAWRITQAESLLDYGAGQTTASFTDPAYPNDAVPLSAFPASAVAAAAALAAAAGITDPGAAQGAIEDYLLTGDASFIASAAQQQTPTKTIAPEPATPASPGSDGIAAVATTVIQAASGPTPVSFTIYRTGPTTAAEVVNYQVQSPSSGYLDGTSFAGGVLPSGQVTIPVGAKSGTLTIDVTGSLGAAVGATLQVAITPAVAGAPVAAGVANVQIGNNLPVAGTPADPVFIDLADTGSIIQNGSSFSLDLGTFDVGGATQTVQVAVANMAAALADDLSGHFVVSAPDGILVTSGYGPITDLGGGRMIALSLAASTVSAGKFSETIDFVANEANESGYAAALGTIELTVTDTVLPAPHGTATPTSIAFGDVHQGAAVSQGVTVTNAASSTGPLAASVESVAGRATAAGSIASLAAGGVDSTDISAGLSTGYLGPQSGVVTLALGAAGATPSGGPELLQPRSVTGTGAFTNAANLLADGAVPPAQTPDGAASVVSWTNAATTFTYDYGAVETLTGATAAVGNDGTYVVSTSADGVRFTPLLTILPSYGNVTPAQGGVDRFSTIAGSGYYTPQIAFAATAARYVRLQATGEAATYAAGELDLFADPPAVAVSGTVYAEAAPSITPPSALIVHVGDPGKASVTVANDAPAGAYSENLVAAVDGLNGGFATAATHTGEIAAGASDATTIALSFDSSRAATLSGTLTLGLASDGGGIDGLGVTALPSQAVNVAVTIDNYATAGFEAISGDALSGGGPGFTLDLGTFERGSGPVSAGFGAVNTAAGPADLLSGSLSASGSSALTLAGLVAFDGLGAGAVDAAPTATLSTADDGTFTQTVVLSATGSNASGYSGALQAETLTVTGTVADLPSPTISAPKTLTTIETLPMQLGAMDVTDPNTVTEPLTITLTDDAGTLSANASGHGAVAGAGTKSLTLTGSVADLDAELASVTYTAAAIGTDAITVTVEDEHRAKSTTTIDVATDPVPQTAPVVNAPVLSIAVVGQASGVGGLSVTDPYAEATGQQVTLTLTSTGLAPETLDVSGGPGGTVTGQGTGTVTITGSLDQVNSYLSDGLTLTILQDAYAKALKDAQKAGVIYGNIMFLNSIGSALADGGVEAAAVEFSNQILMTAGGAIGVPEQPDVGKLLVQTDVGLYSFAANVLNDVAALASGATQLPPPAGAGGGHPFLVTYSGLAFQLEASGEYLLTASNSPGDSFTVGVRLQPIGGGAPVSAMTQIAATVGADRVTFGVGRDAVVYVDGKPATVAAGTPVMLSGGELTLVSPGVYQVSWNTGESLTVMDEGSYLGVKVGLGANDEPGSIVGLLGPDDGQADDFTLPNGTVLSQPLTSSQVTAYANNWLVPQAAGLFDYAPGQSAATFDDPTFPAAELTLADLPADVVAQATAAVAAAGITDPGAAAAAAFDYVISGGDPASVTADEALFQGVSTTLAPITSSGPAPSVLGVIARQPVTPEAPSGPTAVTFEVYLSAAAAAATTVGYAVVAPGATDLGAAAFGGALPSGSVTIAAGETSAQFTVSVPAAALAGLVSGDVAVQISAAAGGPPVIAATATANVTTPQPGAPPQPVLTYMTKFGTFVRDGDDYTLDLGAVQYGQALPDLQFGVENAASAPSDELGGTFSAATVEGFTVSGDKLPAALGAGQTYDGVDATINTIKFGDNSETITFDPTDTNASGYSAPLAPITLTIADTLELPGITYSQAWGDVHIVTYNGLEYNFQAVGEFWLAESKNPADSFGIQLRLQPYYSSAVVTVITQVAVSLGKDRVTFDVSRPNTPFVDGATSTLSAADPLLSLPGGTVTEISPSVFKVSWTTGETATVTDAGAYFNVVDGIPPTDVAGGVAGLQGEAEGQQNDFQLPDGTVLPQPLTTNELYDVYGNAWRVSQATSLFDYGPGQTTATFTDMNFPADVVSLADLPSSVVKQAESVVAAAGITDPAVAQAAEMDYIATGDMSFVTSAADIQQQAGAVTPATVTPSAPPPPEALVEAAPASVAEAASGPTAVTFDAMLTTASATASVIDWKVADGGSGYLGAATFGTVLPSGEVTIAAGQTIVPFTIDVPQAALGTAPNAKLEVQITSPSGAAVFTPSATAEIVNPAAEPGAAAIAALRQLTSYGTLTQQSGGYVLNLGTLPLGAATPVIQLAVANAAAAPADDLSGAFAAPVGSGFVVAGDSLPAVIAAGQEYDGLSVTAATSEAGAHQETLTFSPRDVNDSGYSAALPKITLTIEDAIAGPASAGLNTPDEIVFPNAHVGAAESEPVSVTNTAAAPAASLDVSAFASGSAKTSGAVSGLAPGATDASSISAGLDTSKAGALNGTIQLGPLSDTGQGTPVALSPQPVIDVFGDVYREAAPAVAAVDVHVQAGGPGETALTITNSGSADGFSESLIAALTSASAGIGLATTSATGDIAAGARDSSLGITYSTAKAGVITGTVTLSAVSDGGLGAGSIDGLGQTKLAPVVVPVTIDVEGPAQATFEELAGPGSLTLGASGYSLDLGTVALGAAPISVSLGVLNAAASGSDALSGSFSLSGPSAFAAAGFGAFTGVAAGQADTGLSLVFTPGPAGPSTETVTLDATSVGGAALAPVTLTVTADVMPCFHAGTRIATPDGAVAVETLRVGDLVSTASGGARPIVWVGSRRVDCTRHPRPELVHPVRIAAGAFGPRLPKRDLILSPDHAVFAEGVLIPVKRLVNGASVAVEPRASVEYFHVELDRHDVVLAEGLPTESYLDAGDRDRFSGGARVALHPDFSSRVWEADGCAPLRIVGAEVDRVRDALARRAKRARARTRAARG